MLSVARWKSTVCQTIVFKKQMSIPSVTQTCILLDNQMQLLTAIDDFEYTKWLDPEGVPSYVKDSVVSPYADSM